MNKYSKVLDYARKGSGLMIYLEALSSRNAFEKAKKLIKYVGRSINGIIVEPSAITMFGLEYVSRILLPYIYGADLISAADYPLVSYINVKPSIFKEYGFDMLITDPLYVNSHFKEFSLIHDDGFAIVVNLHGKRSIKYAKKVKVYDAFYVEGSSNIVSQLRKMMECFIITKEGFGGDVNVVTVPLNNDIYLLIKKIESRLSS